MRLSKEKITEQLRKLGIEEGDNIFVSADLMKVGYFNKNQVQTALDWMAIFQNVLGTAGTIFIPSYSDIYPLYRKELPFVFSKDSFSNSGSLANAYIKYAQNSVRSKHPIYSCIGVGPLAKKLFDHDLKAGAYDPYGIIINNNGKNLMLGTIDEKNCPMPFHYAQQSLGHTKRHPLCGMFKTAYLDEKGIKRNVTVNELGGCTRGVHKLWGRHLARDAVVFGKVGRSLSGLVDAKKSYEIMLEVLRCEPSSVKCNNTLCISCYGRFQYNGLGVASFYPRKALHLLVKLLGTKK